MRTGTWLITRAMPVNGPIFQMDLAGGMTNTANAISFIANLTCSHYLNLDLKHICSPPSMLLNCPVRQRL